VDEKHSLVSDKIVAKDLTEDAITEGVTAIMAEAPESVQQLTELSGEGGTTNVGLADDRAWSSEHSAMVASELPVTENSGEGGTMHAGEDGESETRPSKATDVGAAATALLGATGLYGDTAPSDATDPPSDANAAVAQLTQSKTHTRSEAEAPPAEAPPATLLDGSALSAPREMAQDSVADATLVDESNATLAKSHATITVPARRARSSEEGVACACGIRGFSRS